jgi:hypothetical protein
MISFCGIVAVRFAFFIYFSSALSSRLIQLVFLFRFHRRRSIGHVEKKNNLSCLPLIVIGLDASLEALERLSRSFFFEPKVHEFRPTLSAG